jgi:hypothetical protein
MASITADYTGVLPQWMQTTQPMITTSFLEATGLGWSSYVTTGGSTTVITDVNRLLMPYASDRSWRGSYVRMTGGTSANLGAIRQVQGYNQTTGAVTVSPALPAAAAANDTYEMWSTPVFPQTVCNLLDRLVGQYGLGLPTYSVLSEVPDFDMEQSGTSAWTSTNATIAKVPWAASKRGIAGKQAMSVTTTSANGYATCANPIGVKGGTSLILSALFTSDDPSVTVTGFLQLIDATDGSLIDEITTTSKSSVRLMKPIANGSQTSTLVNIRFGQEENGTVGHWDDISLLDAEAMDVPLPYWMGTESAFKEVYFWMPPTSGPGTDEYDPALIGHPAQGWRPFTDMISNGGQLRLRGNSVAQTLMFVQGVRFESPWGTSITDTKRIDIQWATAALAFGYYRLLKGMTILDTQQSKDLTYQIGVWEDQYKEHDRRVRSFARTQESPTITWARI